MVSAILVGAVVASSACTREPADATADNPVVVVTPDKPNAGSSDTPLAASKTAGEKTEDATKNAVEAIGDKTKEIAVKTADKTEDIARAVGSETKHVVSKTGEVITDGWITANVSARFVDEALLKGSNINVDTTEHTVTLKGTVKSDAAKARAAAIAGGTEGVKHVVNQLVVRA